MKKIFFAFILIICISLLNGCSNERKSVTKNNETEGGDNTVYRTYENAIEISQDFATIKLEYLPEKYEDENLTILLTNCSDDKIVQKEYKKDNVLFENLSSGTYVIQAYLTSDDEYVDLSSYITIIYDNIDDNSFMGL